MPGGNDKKRNDDNEKLEELRRKYKAGDAGGNSSKDSRNAERRPENTTDEEGPDGRDSRKRPGRRNDEACGAEAGTPREARRPARLFAARQTGAKGCLPLVLIILGIGVLIFFASTFAHTFSFESLPRFIGKAPEGFTIEWPFGKSAKKKPGAGMAASTASSGPDSGTASADSANANASADSASDAAGDAASADSASDAASAGSGPSAGGPNWDDYNESLGKHNELKNAISDFRDRKIGTDDFLAVCEAVKAHFDGVMKNMRNGEYSGARRTFVSMYTAAAMSDQIATGSILKIQNADILSELDNPSSEFHRNFEQAGEAYDTIDARRAEFEPAP